MQTVYDETHNLIDLNEDIEKVKKSKLPDAVSSSDPILRTELEDYIWKSHEEAVELADELARKCLEYNAVGLSANQLGLKDRVCVIKNNPMIVMFNPKIVYYSDKKEYNEEGCVSFPNLIGKVKRSTEIRVRYIQPNGNIVTEKYTGMTARIIQHEVDHLNGIVFTDRMILMHKDRAYRQKKKYDRR